MSELPAWPGVPRSTRRWPTRRGCRSPIPCWPGTRRRPSWPPCWPCRPTCSPITCTCWSRPGSSPAAGPKATAAAPTCNWSPPRWTRWPTRPAAPRGGSCSCARPTRPARTWPRRCGDGPAPSRPYRPAPTPPHGSIPARSPPPAATACRCPGCGPATSTRSKTRGTWWSPSAIWPARNSAGPRRCTGPCRTRSRPATRPASTRPLAELSRRVERLAPRLAATS